MAGSSFAKFATTPSKADDPRGVFVAAIMEKEPRRWRRCRRCVAVAVADAVAVAVAGAVAALKKYTFTNLYGKQAFWLKTCRHSVRLDNDASDMMAVPGNARKRPQTFEKFPKTFENVER